MQESHLHLQVLQPENNPIMQDKLDTSVQPVSNLESKS